MVLSVVIPVFNGEKTIKRCLDSVLSQTLEDIEVIVVNDGSTDGTADVVEDLDDRRIKLITVENGGQGTARNIGMDVACGEYIGFVDADDTVSPDMYEIMCGFAKEHNAEVVQCAINDIRSSGCSVRPELCDEFVIITDRSEYTDSYFYTSKHTNEVCNKIFSACFLKDSGLLFSDTRKVFSEDLKFNIDLLSHIKSIGFIQKPLYNYYISEAGHCRIKTPERVEKILDLYVGATEEACDRRMRGALRSMAVVNVLLYSVPVIDDVKNIVCSGIMKKFMLSSCFYKKSIRHAMLMMALILLPFFLKKKVIVRHYTF